MTTSVSSLCQGLQEQHQRHNTSVQFDVYHNEIQSTAAAWVSSRTSVSSLCPRSQEHQQRDRTSVQYGIIRTHYMSHTTQRCLAILVGHCNFESCRSNLRLILDWLLWDSWSFEGKSDDWSLLQSQQVFILSATASDQPFKHSKNHQHDAIWRSSHLI